MNMNNPLIGNFNQLVKARRFTLREGASDGVQVVELHNQSGLYLTCIEDHCLNIYDFSYKGVNCAFQTKNGLKSNKFFNGGCGEFSYYWPAGMLYTCGIANVGTPVNENGIFHPQHGRIGMTPAENVSVEKNGDGIVVKGTMRDSLLCGHNMELKREIRFPSEGKEVQIRDTVTNLEPMAEPMMILYHCNFGYPLLAPGVRMVKGSGDIIDNLGSGVAPQNCGIVEEPKTDKVEEVYCHTNTPDENGYGYAAIINDELELGCYVKYKMDTLPLMMQWKNLCTHDYCVGLEPSNSYILGREKEREHGTLPILEPYESKVYEVAIGILDGKEEIEAFERKLKF